MNNNTLCYIRIIVFHLNIENITTNIFFCNRINLRDNPTGFSCHKHMSFVLRLSILDSSIYNTQNIIQCLRISDAKPQPVSRARLFTS